ncbi:MAG TPA: hypothetical protein VG452_07815 [Egibacteraceae bacterium]|nr:hypothetical protein [Egibacteraceae bacterium]
MFPVVGGGARDGVEELRLCPGIDVVASPRAATVLLVAGWLPAALRPAAAQVHDQLPHPRATVCWARGDLAAAAETFPAATVVPPDGDVVAVLKRVHRGLVTGERDSEASLLPHEPPSPWKGVGPHGQGGEGMMGGRPYGRPMPMTGPDRDGLALDRLPLRVGPFFPALPAGLVLDVVLQGDVVQEASIAANAFADAAAAAERAAVAPGFGDDPFRRALREPVGVPLLELARAGHHLRWAAATLRLHGLRAAALRTLSLAVGLTSDALPRLAALRRRLERDPTLRWATRGVGRVSAAQLPAGLGGPVARAAGVVRDARLDDPAYADLGFRPVTHDGADAWARFRQRLGEAEQSLRLAQAAQSGAPASVARDRVESPQGELSTASAPSGLLLGLVGDLLAGMEWGDAVATIASLDFDLEAQPAAQVGVTLR